MPTNPSLSSVPVEELTPDELLNAFEKAACILHEANLEVGETDEDFDWDSAHERYDDARQALKDALNPRPSRSPSPPVEDTGSPNWNPPEIAALRDRDYKRINDPRRPVAPPVEAPEKLTSGLDEETERRIHALRDGGIEDIKALRQRIRTLVEEARKLGQNQILDHYRIVPPSNDIVSLNTYEP